VSREVAANRGRYDYRAWRADQRARAQARRPKPFKLSGARLATQVSGLGPLRRRGRATVFPAGADHVEGDADRGGDRRRRCLSRVLDELVPPWRHVERCANNRIEADHRRLKYRLRPMRSNPNAPRRFIITGVDSQRIDRVRRSHRDPVEISEISTGGTGSRPSTGTWCHDPGRTAAPPRYPLGWRSRG
jgi:hypothetical protein